MTGRQHWVEMWPTNIYFRSTLLDTVSQPRKFLVIQYLGQITDVQLLLQWKKRSCQIEAGIQWILFHIHPHKILELKSNITIFIFVGHNKFRIWESQILPIVTFQSWVWFLLSINLTINIGKPEYFTQIHWQSEKNVYNFLWQELGDIKERFEMKACFCFQTGISFESIFTAGNNKYPFSVVSK